MPTRTGLGVMIGAILLGALGVRARYAELVVVAVMALAAVVIAAVLVRRAPTVVILRTPLPTRAERGSQIRCRAKVTSTSRRGVAAATLRDRLGDDSVGLDLPATPTDQGITVGYGLTAGRRGVTTIGPLSIHRADPFGLVAGEHLVAGTVATVLIHPRVVPLHGQRFIERVTATESAMRRGGSDSSSGFQSLRPYGPGDDTRTIHWPTTARTGAYMVREYSDPRRPTLTVVLMTDQSDYTSEFFENATEIAASLCSYALRHGLDVHLATTDPQHPGSSRPLRDEPEALDVLARVQLTPAMATRPLGEIVHVTPRATCAFVLSGRSEEGLHRFVDLADRVMYVSVADAADGLPRLIGSRGDDVVAPTAEAFARWWVQAS